MSDSVNAEAEYGAQFRSDLEDYVSREIVDALIAPGRYELPPLSDTRYMAFCDPSGGGADSMTLAIGHYGGARNANPHPRCGARGATTV